MKYHVNAQNKESAYLQLYRQLRKDITNRVYRFGDKLPSKRLLSEESGVSVVTVVHALEILCDEGYVEARERKGYFVTYRQSDFMPVCEVEEQRIEHSVIVPHSEDDFPFSVFAKTMRNVLSVYGERILIKSPNTGCEELRQAISEYLARAKGIIVPQSRIIIGSGSEYLYGLIVQVLGRERIYALEDPSYEKIHSVYHANGAVCDFLKLGKNGIFSSELQRTKASVLHVSPFRSYPSGVSANASKRAEYIQWAKSCERIIVEDDFESEFSVSSKNEDSLFATENGRNVIYVNTFTKTVAPSMRVAYMVLPESLEKDFQEKAGFYSCTVPTFEQYVLAEFIKNGDFERHINRVRRNRRQALLKG